MDDEDDKHTDVTYGDGIVTKLGNLMITLSRALGNFSQNSRDRYTAGQIVVGFLMQHGIGVGELHFHLKDGKFVGDCSPLLNASLHEVIDAMVDEGQRDKQPTDPREFGVSAQPLTPPMPTVEGPAGRVIKTFDVADIMRKHGDIMIEVARAESVKAQDPRSPNRGAEWFTIRDHLKAASVSHNVVALVNPLLREALYAYASSNGYPMQERVTAYNAYRSICQLIKAPVGVDPVVS
jgi:hypothetical protein